MGMKTILKWTAYGIIFSIVGFTAFNIITDDTAKKLEELPQITNRDELVSAMKSPNQSYIILDAPLFGTAVTDSLGILPDDYIYLDYDKEEYLFERRYNAANEEYEYFYSWERVEDPPVLLAEEYYIYDNISLNFGEYRIEEAIRITDSSGMTLSEEQYFDESGSYYYPYGDDIGSDYYPDDGDGQVRYAIYGVEEGTPVSFLAVVGDGAIRPYHEENMVQFVVNGSIEELDYYETEERTTIVMLVCIFGALLAFVLLFISRCIL